MKALRLTIILSLFCTERLHKSYEFVQNFLSSLIFPKMLEFASISFIATFVALLSVGVALPVNPCLSNPTNGTKFYTDSNDCKIFHMCDRKNLAGTFSCGNEMAFNDEINTCIRRKNAERFCNRVVGDPIPGPCDGNAAPFEYITSVKNCNSFHLCRRSSLVATLRCHPRDNFNDQIRACVVRGSVLDICGKPGDSKVSTTPKPLPTKPCRTKTSGLYPHPTNCAQYYDCSKRGEMMFGFDQRYECLFPKLYDISSRSCKHFSQVTCGIRKEPKSGCEYVRNQCQRAHCIPCYIIYPTCTNLPDGFHPWKGKENSPYYVECKNGRAVRELRCPSTTPIFDPKTRRCVKNKST